MISRIFRGENENAAVKRKRQIDTLKIFNDNVVELREDVEYQVEFESGDMRMAIMVSLSPEFPLEKPVLRVSPPVNHSWCNEHSEITSAPGLLNFTVHSDLGRVVQAIIREFSKNPPQLKDDISLASNISHRELTDRASPSYSLRGYSDHPSTSYNCYYNSQYSQYSSPVTNQTTNYSYNYIDNGNTINTMNCSSPPQYTNDTRTTGYISPLKNSHYINTNYIVRNLSGQSVISHEFPELNNFSNDELRKLAADDDNDEKLDIFIDEHSQLKQVNLAIDEAIDNIEKIASNNLAKETELKILQDDVSAKVQKVSVLKNRYDTLIQQYNKLSEVFSPDHIKECLKNSADESHEKSEQIAENFLEGKIDVENFLSTYVECRKLGQARRTKEEKLAHQLNELKRAGY